MKFKVYKKRNELDFHLTYFLLDERVPTELKKNIMQARMDKKLTQAQLAKVCLFFYSCLLSSDIYYVFWTKLN